MRDGRFFRIRRVFELVRPYKKNYIAVILLHMVAIASRMAWPKVSQILVDDVIGNNQIAKLYWVLGLMLGLGVLRNVIFVVRCYIAELMGQGAICELKFKLFRHLQRLPFSFYDEHRVGEIMSRLTGDIDGLRHMITMGWVQVMEMALFFVGATVLMVFINWQVTLLILLVMPFLGILAYRYDRKVKPVYADIREQNAQLNTRVQENFSGVRVVKAFAREAHEIQTFDVENDEVLRRNLSAVHIWSRFNPIIDFLGGLPTIILMLAGTLFALAAPERMSLGNLVAMNGYLWMICDPLRNISWLVNMVQQSLTSSEKIFYYLDMGVTIKDKPDAAAPDEMRGHVQFENVSFRYGDELVLEHVSFDVPPGRTLAVMGATGCGKTSIVNLLPRFYECCGGSVRVDGVDVKDYPLQTLRRAIGNVMQETFLFSETLENNIAFGRPALTHEEVCAATAVAQGADFIGQMERGYESPVGERGLGLSGGQKQRVAIARALAIRPKILILDDATSAVDMETEYAIQQNLKEALEQTTKIIIAHRISSVKDADEIIVLEAGRVAERGTHQFLLAQKGMYWQMFREQYSDYEALGGGGLA